MKLREKACDPCITEKITEGDLVIQFSVDDENTAIPYQVFEGNYEKGIVVVTDTSKTKERTHKLATGKTYTVAARYIYHEEKTMVIDADKIKATKASCSDPEDPEQTIYCWYVSPGRADVRLK